jgi:hypothetical protein
MPRAIRLAQTSRAHPILEQFALIFNERKTRAPRGTRFEELFLFVLARSASDEAIQSFRAERFPDCSLRSQ